MNKQIQPDAGEQKCELCGEPMPQGEEMFKYHGYSGSCPKPPLEHPDQLQVLEDADLRKKIESLFLSRMETVDSIMELVLEQRQAWEREAYDRGYNTGWQKSKRSHDVRRLNVAAEQLETLAKTIRESAELAQKITSVKEQQ